MKLSVNIDHIATLRQARLANEPDPVYAAVLAELGGADGITLHLRQDRRHVQERDLDLLRQVIKTRVNLEMAVAMDMVKIALKHKPDQCTLVAETAEEITTSGGMDVIPFAEKIEEALQNLHAAGIAVSTFIDPDSDQIKACYRLGIRAVELNTNAYSQKANTPYAHLEIEKLQKAAIYAKKLNLRVLAGHGLTYQNVSLIAAIKEIEELNIGHSIIANAAYWGMQAAVEKMKSLMRS